MIFIPSHDFISLSLPVSVCARADLCALALHPYYYRLVNPEASIQAIKDVVAESDPDVDMATPSEDNDKFGFPRFAQLVSYFYLSNHALPASFGGGPAKSLTAAKLPPKPFAAALALARRIGIWEALGTRQLDIKIDEDWDCNVDAIVGSDESARSLVEAFFETQEPSVVTTLLDTAWEAMVYAGGEALDAGIRNIWNDLAVLVPQSVLQRYTDHHLSAISKLLLVGTHRAETRREIAFAVGLLGSFPATVGEPSQLAQDLVSGIVAGGGGGHPSGAAVLGLGYLLTRLKVRGRLSIVGADVVRSGIQATVTVLTSSRDTALVETAIDALAEFAAFNVVDEGMIDVDEVQKALLEQAKRGHEKAVQALGYLCFLYPEDSAQALAIIEELVKVGETGGVEASFAVGEALANASAGWGSRAVRRGRRSIAGVQWAGAGARRGGVPKLLDRFLQRASEPGGGPGKRRTTVVGLLSVFEFCSEDNDTVKKSLGSAQQAFRSFLTDRDGESPSPSPPFLPYFLPSFLLS